MINRIIDFVLPFCCYFCDSLLSPKIGTIHRMLEKRPLICANFYVLSASAIGRQPAPHNDGKTSYGFVEGFALHLSGYGIGLGL